MYHNKGDGESGHRGSSRSRLSVRQDRPPCSARSVMSCALIAADAGLANGASGLYRRTADSANCVGARAAVAWRQPTSPWTGSELPRYSGQLLPRCSGGGLSPADLEPTYPKYRLRSVRYTSHFAGPAPPATGRNRLLTDTLRPKVVKHCSSAPDIHRAINHLRGKGFDGGCFTARSCAW